MFCQSKEENLTCRFCQRTCHGLECFNEHKVICHKGIMLHCCKSFIYVCKDLPSREEIIKAHICTKICKKCKTEIKTTSDHQCKFKKIYLNFRKPKISYFYIAFENMSGASCQQCFNANCQIHDKNKEYVPAVLGLAEQLRGPDYKIRYFLKYCLSNDSLPFQKL